jgi:hypothetical protein
MPCARWPCRGREGYCENLERCGPRVNDQRHYFAIRTVLNWYQSNADVDAHLPEPATYLGHVQVRDS